MVYGGTLPVALGFPKDLLTVLGANKYIVYDDPHRHICLLSMVTMNGVEGLTECLPRLSDPGTSGLGVDNSRAEA
jgi:hypothetical protein